MAKQVSVNQLLVVQSINYLLYNRIITCTVESLLVQLNHYSYNWIITRTIESLLVQLNELPALPSDKHDQEHLVFHNKIRKSSELNPIGWDEWAAFCFYWYQMTPDKQPVILQPHLWLSHQIINWIKIKIDHI